MKSRGKKKVWGPMASNSHRRNLDTMHLLTGDNSFQEVVGSVRAHLNIPKGGLSDKSENIQKKWSKFYTEETYRLQDDPRLIEQENRIIGKIRTGELTERMGNKQLELLHDKIPNKYLENRGREIGEKFNLPIHFNEHLIAYIIRGEITAPQHNYKATGIHVRNSTSDQRRLPLEIYTRLTPDELEELKQYIETFARKLPQYPPLKDIQTKLEIEKLLKEADKTAPERRTAGDLAEHYFGDRKKANKVHDIMRSLRELRQKRFSDRGKK